jgi:hypothetical protein
MNSRQSIYTAEHSALLAVDLLRRDPGGCAARLAATAAHIGHTRRRTGTGRAAPIGDVDTNPGREAARQRALNASIDVVLTKMSVRQAYGLSEGDRLLATVGDARDAWEAVQAFDMPSSLSADVLAIADAVLALWACKDIDIEDFIVLIAPARAFVQAGERGRGAYRFGFGDHTAKVHDLVRRVERLTAAEIVAMDDDPPLDGEWEDAHARAADAINHAGGNLTYFHTVANLAAMGMLGASARSLRVQTGYQMVAAVNLAGAVSATLATDMITALDFDLLMRDWR